MKARFALLAMVVVAAAPLAAQGGGGGGGRVNPMMNADSLGSWLTLTSAQKTQTQAMIDDYNKNSAPLQAYVRAAGRGNAAPDSMTKMTNMRTDFTNKLKAILTPDQSKKFDSLSTAMQGRGRRGGGGK
jgi:Spy/CpxP family protein refolding chaperone